MTRSSAHSEEQACTPLACGTWLLMTYSKQRLHELTRLWDAVSATCAWYNDLTIAVVLHAGEPALVQQQLQAISKVSSGPWRLLVHLRAMALPRAKCLLQL